MGFSGGGAQQYLSPPVQEESSFPSGAVHHPAEKLAPNTHWVGFVCVPRHKDPNARRCWWPQQSRESCLGQAHGRQPVLPGTTEWHTSTQHSWAPAPCKRKAAAGCIAKLCVGSFLATHGISSYCYSSLRLLLQSLAKGSSICCLQLLSFMGHAGEEPAAWKVAEPGLSVGFLLAFLHMVPQQLAQRTLSNSSTCCGAKLPCLCHTDASDITYSCPQKAKVVVAGPAQRCPKCPRKGAEPGKTA